MQPRQLSPQPRPLPLPRVSLGGTGCQDVGGKLEAMGCARRCACPLYLCTHSLVPARQCPLCHAHPCTAFHPPSPTHAATAIAEAEVTVRTTGRASGCGSATASSTAGKLAYRVRRAGRLLKGVGDHPKASECLSQRADQCFGFSLFAAVADAVASAAATAIANASCFCSSAGSAARSAAISRNIAVASVTITARACASNGGTSTGRAGDNAAAGMRGSQTSTGEQHCLPHRVSCIASHCLGAAAFHSRPLNPPPLPSLREEGTATATAVAEATAFSFAQAFAALRACKNPSAVAIQPQPPTGAVQPPANTPQPPSQLPACFGFVRAQCCLPSPPQRCVCGAGNLCAYMLSQARPLMYTVAGADGTPLMSTACACP